MLRTRYFLAVYVALAMLSVSLFGQDDPFELYSESRSKIIFIDFNGQAKLSESTALDWRLPFKTYELLDSSEVRKELELVPDQVKRIELKSEQFEKMRLGLRKKRMEGQIDANKEYQTLTKFARDQFFDDILLPHQLEALSERLDRWELARSGPFGSIAKADELTKEQKQMCIKAAKALRKKIQKLHVEASDFERRLISESLEPIDLVAAKKILKTIGEKPVHLGFSLLLFSMANGISLPEIDK
jgi:hypothetical protein